jgi:thiol-disulfide isomerase/thioredoxin
MLVVVWAFTGCHGGGDAAAYKPISVGDAVPQFAVRTLAGDTARIAPGQPLTLVNIWATWCVPCVREFDDLQRLHQTWAPRGLRVLAVSIDHADDDAVAAFVQDHRASFAIGRDPDSRVQELFNGFGVPQSYLISRDGKLLWKSIGALQNGGADVAAIVRKELE